MRNKAKNEARQKKEMQDQLTVTEDKWKKDAMQANQKAADELSGLVHVAAEKKAKVTTEKEIKASAAKTLKAAEANRARTRKNVQIEAEQMMQDETKQKATQRATAPKSR